MTLDSDLSGETTVFAMAHVDSDGDRVYEFVSANAAVDGPYTAAGAPVMSSATVDAPAMATTTDSMTTDATTDGMTTTDSMDGTDGASGGSVPGFGLGVALVAVLGAALLALRQR